MLIDAHVHVCVNEPERYPWQPLLNYIPTTFAPAERLIEEMDWHGIDRACLVQPSYYGYDNRYMVESLQRYPDRFAAVCLVDPASPGVWADLARWMGEGCVGLRLNPVGDLEGNWQRPGVWEAAADLGAVVCLQIKPEGLADLAVLAQRYPTVRIVVDHLGRANLSDLNGPLFDLAACPNVYVKVSGIAAITRAAHPYADSHAFVDRVRQAFGAGRLLWGSDFPGHLGRGGYSAELEVVQAQRFWAPEEREQLLAGTALRLFWRHGPRASFGFETGRSR